MDYRRVLISVGAFGLGFGFIVLGGQVILPHMSGSIRVPAGQYLQGAVVGLLNALLAMGLVLIYRSNRIINFAQGELGAFAAIMTAEVYQRFRWAFLPALLFGLATAILMSMFIEFAVIRRFRKAPRLILTVATIGVAQILGAFELAIPFILNRGRDVTGFQSNFQSPYSFAFSFSGVRFTSDHIIVLLVAPVVLAGLVFFFRYSRYGVAARAVAENEDRARLLGVRVKRVSLVVWGLAGFLSAITAILRAPIFKDINLGAIGGPSLIFRALAAAVIARMESLPITAAAAVLLTMGEQTIFFTYLKTGPTDGFLLAVIVIALVLQRKRLGRVDPASSTWQAVQEIRAIPRELRKLPEIRWVRTALVAVLLAVALLVPLVLSPGRTLLASTLHVYAMIGISLVILTGWSGNVSLGQSALVGIGAFTAQRLATREVPMDFFAILLLAALMGAAVALAIGLPALRIRGLFLGVTTLALAVAASSWFFQWDILSYRGGVPRPVIFGLFDVSSERAFYYVTFVGLLFALFVGRNIRRSRLGRVLIALRDNETQAQSVGIRPTRAKLTAFAIAGFLAALAGAFYVYSVQGLRADRFPASDSILMFTIVVIGGMGSMTGAILGAAYVKFIQYFLPSQFQLFATGAGLLILLLVFPGGLGAIAFSARDWYLRRVAARRNIIVPSLVADRREPDVLVGAQPPDEPEPEPVRVGGRS
jgi:branched-chain amino acid transport system permease protein